MTRAVDLLKNKFGVSQLYKHDVIKDDDIILTVYWHPLTIAERESIQKKTGIEDTNDYALQLMIEKALDKDHNKMFNASHILSFKQKADTDILARVASQIMGTNTETFDDVKKK